MNTLAKSLLGLALLCPLAPGITTPSMAQEPGENVAAYNNPTGSSWTPMLGTGAGGSATLPGRPVDLFCQNGVGNWVPCAGGSSVTAPNSATWTISSSCGGQTNCTQIFADTKYVVDATSTSTTTITAPDANFQCPNNSFPCAPTGTVTAWATTQGSGAGVGFLLYTTFVCPQTTITQYVSSTQATLANACTANASGNAVFIWGHDDGATLAALDGNEGCAVVHVATANTFIMTGQPFMVIQPSGSTCNRQLNLSSGAVQPALVGDGFGASQAVFVITPNFNWVGCQAITGASNNVCFGGVARTIANIQLWGTGLTSASNANCSGAHNKVMLSGYPPSTVLYGDDVGGICPGESNMFGVEVNSADEAFDLGGAQSVGQYACETFGGVNGIVLRSNDCRNDNVSGGYGLYVRNATTVYSLDNYPLVATLISGATLNSEGGTYQGTGTTPGVEIQSGGSFNGHEDSHQGMLIDSGGFASVSNQNFQPFNGATITVNGNFTDLGANYWATTPPSTGTTGSWQAASSTTLLFGSCRGTATSSSTLGLYGMGQFSTQNCTSTTVVAGQPYRSISRAGKVSTLACNAGTGGVNSSSGVVTVLKNGSPTTITATFGTGRTAMDNTHTDTPALGDVYSIQFTTQASETLANVTCTLLGW